jgi:HlyD family secretion protein
MKRLIPRLVGGAALIGAVAFLWIVKPWAKAEAAITFSTVAVGRGNIQAQVSANGTLSARSTVQVGAQVTGRIIELKKDFNDEVKKDEVIAKLDDLLAKAQIEQSQAAYDVAAANENRAAVAVVDAERQFKRQKGLQEQQLVAGATVDTAETAWQTARANLVAARASVSQAAANLKQARQNLTYCTITSPVNGIILSRAVELGQTVSSSLQVATMFTIAEDLTSMQIDTAVAESDVGRLAEKMKVTFTVDAFPGRPFEGVVRQVRNAPTTQSGVVTYDAVIDVDNKDKALRPGMTANVTFVLDQVADAIKIPNAALRFKPSREQIQAVMAQFGIEGRGGGSGGRGSGRRGSGGSGERPSEVEGGGPPGGGPGGPGGAGGRGNRDPDRRALWKLVDGTPKRVMVKLGLTDGSSTQIVEGDLQPGDQLITEIQGVAAQQRKVGAF